MMQSYQIFSPVLEALNSHFDYRSNHNVSTDILLLHVIMIAEAFSCECLIANQIILFSPDYLFVPR